MTGVRTPSFFLLLDPWSPLPNCHGGREPWSFFGGGKGCRQAARPSSPCTRGGGANHNGKGEGARSWTRPRTGPRRSRRTGRRAGLASVGGSVSPGGSSRGRPLRVHHQAAPGTSPSPPPPGPLRGRLGGGTTRDAETAHEGLRDQWYASPRRIPSPRRDVSWPRVEVVRPDPQLDGGVHPPFQADGGRSPLRQGLPGPRHPGPVLRG